MKIQKVKITKYKCLEDIEKEVNGSNVLLIGDNEVGKSSFIQFIELALGKDIKIPAEGVVWADKDGNQYVFEVKPTNTGKNRVIIHTPDGFKDDRKGVLANIVGPMEFDINDFVDKSKTDKGRKEQVEFFKSILPEEIRNELIRLERNIEVNYNDRTDVHREVTRLKGAIAKSPLYNSIDRLDHYKQIDLEQTYQKLKEANEHNTKIEGVKQRLESRKEEVAREESQIKELEKKIAEIKASLEEKAKANQQAETWLKENKEIITAPLEETIKKASDTNKDYEEAVRLKKMKEELLKNENQYGELTALIDSSRQAISDTIKSMDTPVQGLEYLDDGLYYTVPGTDTPILVHPDYLSESTIMEIGVKMKMAENPGLGILFLERTESIGKKRWEYILKIAKDNNMQVIAEQVQRGKDKLLIELFS